MYHDVYNKLNVNNPYDMELRFLFDEHTSISISPLKVTFDVEMKVLEPKSNDFYLRDFNEEECPRG